MFRSSSIRASLLRDMVLLVGLVGGAVVALTLVSARQATRAIAEAALGARLARVESALALEAPRALAPALLGDLARGAVLVAGEDGRVLAAPRASGLGTRARLVAWLPAAAALAKLEAPSAGADRAVRFHAAGDVWWASTRVASTHAAGTVRLLAIAPEAALLTDLPPLGLWLGAIAAAVIGIAVLRALALARRYSRPVAALVAESDRISRGELDPGPPIESDVKEIRRLAQAHERMREGLAALIRLESDLALAKRIQQNTLPERLPDLAGFDVDAFSEPAEQTGGDTFDVVGLKRHRDGRRFVLANDDAERAVLLLADATGHGIGPALSATQVRAMLRMAARGGAPLEEIVTQINEQLCDDLFGGRFITAWIGVLDARRGTLTSFSAGQAPLLHYHAAAARMEELPADGPPLGIDRDLQIPALPARALAPGDLFAVLSDGLLEATAPDGERFGQARAIEVIARHHAETSGLVLTRLRQAVAQFAAGTAAEDDRTAIIVKREGV